MAEIKDYYGDDNLQRIKRNIATSYLYFEDNYKRFRDFRRFVFCESVTEDQRSMLRRLNRPATEFNILEAYLSRLLGEFSKQEPSIIVSPAEDAPVPDQLLKLIENNIRHTMYDANKNSFAYEVYKDLLSGGFSVGKVWTEYATPMSLDQIIRWDRAFDPTLCGFDPLARSSHKGDGGYSFELFPMLEEDFQLKYPDLHVEELEYLRDIEGFSWTYEDSQQRKTILMCDYYEKKKRRVKIVKLANGATMPLSEYHKLEKKWEELHILEQIPVVTGKRTTELETICHYRMIGCKVLEYRETDYTFLPHVFFDGHSIILSRGESSSQSYQMTRPYVYHARGIQDLKNFAGQTLANYLQNQVQHKFIVMKEAIPQEKDYLAALTNPQRASTLVVNAFNENNPDQPIPTPIREVQNVPAPPEVMQAFQVTDPTTQTILGSYASNLGQNDNDLSGKAVIETATVGNAAAMPYVVGYLAGLNQMAIIHTNLLPKYVLGKRKLPTMDNAGKRSYEEVNTKEAPKLDYSDHALNVCIEAGVNFQVQKNQALQQITALMQASEEFSMFMNDDETLPILVDNLTIYGADRLKEAVPRWIEKKAQQQQQAMQMQQQQMQNDPNMIRAQAEMEKVKQKGAQDQVENQIAIAKLEVEKELAQAKLMEAEAKISAAQVDQVIRLEEGETSRFNHSIDNATKIAELEFKEHQRNLSTHDAMLKHGELIHKMEKANKPEKKNE
jgi:hypothetical protein